MQENSNATEQKNIGQVKPKIIDCFTFFNELDLLEGRLEYLYDVVDYFVIVEANLTHSGQPKPFNYTENISRFKKYQNKILYFPISISLADFPWDNSPEAMAAQTSTFWKIENYQRNSIRLGLNLFEETDIILLSDLDEIPQRENIVLFSMWLETSQIIALEQRMKVCNLDEQPGFWVGPVMTYIKHTRGVCDLQWFRQYRFEFSRVRNGGWHLTWWGGPEQALAKIKNYSHQEVNTPENADMTRIKDRLSQNKHPVEELAVHNACPPEGPLPENFVSIFSKYIK
jgi:beta-1,4-mannosyl-glycoprotein beta-1,4-N-acetylglucosaminyltransferase